MATATESIAEAREREMDERSLHGRMKWFVGKWSNDMDADDANEFQADLLILIQAIHRDASRETQALLRNALAAMPPQPIFIDKK